MISLIRSSIFESLIHEDPATLCVLLFGTLLVFMHILSMSPRMKDWWRILTLVMDIVGLMAVILTRNPKGLMDLWVLGLCEMGFIMLGIKMFLDHKQANKDVQFKKLEEEL